MENNIVFSKNNFRIRKAEVEDINTIYKLITGIAEYEKMM